MARRLGTGIMAPKRELSDVTPVELAGAAAGRTRENNGLNAKEIVEVLSAAGIPPKRRRKENEKLLLVNLTTVLETRGWSNEKVTDDIVERCGPIRNWDAWADDVVVKALKEERKERGDRRRADRADPDHDHRSEDEAGNSGSGRDAAGPGRSSRRSQPDHS